MSELAQVFAGTSMRWFTDQEVTSLMTSSRLSAKARTYMKSHPGVNYTEALSIVSGKPEPLLGGAMSDMLSRIVGAGTPTPDLDSAMQSLGFDFPPKSSDDATPLTAADAHQGDVAKVGGRYGLLLDDKGTVLLDGKIVNLADYGDVEFFRMAAPDDLAHTPTSTSRAINGMSLEQLTERWERNEFTNRLHVPLGHDESGRVLGIDLMEPSMAGTGPHGCIQGQTGMGKSALVENILYALAAENSPTKVTFALADFKSHGGTQLRELPHTVFAQEWGTGEHWGIADFITAEMSRREAVLRKHNAKDHITYIEMRREDTSLPPLPRLVVVMEEARDVIHGKYGREYDTLMYICRAGRALGVHLIVVEQRFDHPVFEHVLPHIGFGISFRTDRQALSWLIPEAPWSETPLDNRVGHAWVRRGTSYDREVSPLRTFAPVHGAELNTLTAALDAAAREWETAS